MCVRENTQRSCRSIQYSVDLLLSVIKWQMNRAMERKLRKTVITMF